MGLSDLYGLIIHPIENYRNFKYSKIIQKKAFELKKSNRYLIKRVRELVDVNEELDYEVELFQDLNGPLVERISALERVCCQQKKAMAEKNRNLKEKEEKYKSDLEILNMAYEGSMGFFISKKKAIINKDRLKEAYLFLVKKGFSAKEIKELEEDIGVRGIISYEENFDKLIGKMK